MKKIVAERLIHKGINRVALRFPYDAELIKIAKGLADPLWSSQMKCWHIPDTPDIISLLLKAFYGKAYVDYTALKPNLAEKIKVKKEEEQRIFIGKKKVMDDAELHPLSEKGRGDIEKYRRWMESNRYHESTIQTYTAMMVKFLRFVSPKEAQD